MTRIPAASVTEAIAKRNSIDYDTWMPERRWDDLERALTSLRDEPDREGDRDYATGYREFIAYTARSGRIALDHLRQWQAQRPDSRFTAMLEVAYWAACFEQSRGTDTADQVTPAMWAGAHAAQDMMFCALIRMLAKDRSAWPVITSVIYSVAAVGEPKWWTQWLLRGEAPQALPSHAPADGIDEGLAQSGADEAGPQYLRDQPGRLAEVLTGPALAWRRAQSNDRSAASQYWVRVALEMDPQALDAAIAYVAMRMPRWGGSWDEMLAFADSPLCEHFDEHDRNVLRFFAWFDELEVEDSDMLDDPRVLKHHLRLGQRLLERPLRENLRGRVHKYLAYLEAKNDRIDAACTHYALSAPHNEFQEWEIVRAVETWCASEDKGAWLGQIAEVNRLVSAQGAALYGLLCQTGWAGVAHRPEVADGWFERAAKMTPDLSDVRNSPFNALSELAAAFGDEALLPMWLKATELGDASSQFCCGNYFTYDRVRAIQLFRLAADNHHEVAMYNVAALSLIPVRDGDIVGSQADAATADALDYLDRALARTEIMLQRDPTEFAEGQLETVKDLYGTLLRSDWPPLFARRHVLPQVLQFAGQGRINAMMSLAWWYGDKNLDAYRYDEAVRWVEAARHIDPDNEYVQKVLEFVEGDSLWSRMKFAMAQRKVKRQGLPGQDETML
ncbi:MAG: DUF4034 domain-containing protein [Lysobacter sp.]